MEGREVEQNIVLGEAWLRRSARAGDPEAAALVSDLYAKAGPLPAPRIGIGVPPKLGTPQRRALGSLYLTGAGVARDAGGGALVAHRSRGWRPSHRSISPISCLMAKAAPKIRYVAQWFAEAAQSGDLVAVFNFGVCLANGVGVEQDEPRAAQWLSCAAQGVVDAQYFYGRMLAEGRGVAPDLAGAREWFGRAAEAGMPDAQVALAELFVNGRGGTANPSAALSLLEKAAANGHSGAMFGLGALHGGGHGLPLDREAAQRWFRAAAERGHGHAQLMLSRYLASGIAGEYDPVEAQAWLERAIVQGVVEAQQEAAELPREPLQKLGPQSCMMWFGGVEVQRLGDEAADAGDGGL